MKSNATSDSPTDTFRALQRFASELSEPRSTTKLSGRVDAIGPSSVKVKGLARISRLGDLVLIAGKTRECYGQVIAVSRDEITIKPLDSRVDAMLGSPVWHVGEFHVWPSESWLGRVVSALGDPIDNLGDLPRGSEKRGVNTAAPIATQRSRLGKGIVTGVRAVDLFTPLCYGQRMGVFAGSGVGKSTLLAMLARSPGFEVAVIALVGERGREVNEFIEEVLGPARQKSVVVVATGDDSAGLRKSAPMLATSVAEYFRDRGKQVLLIMDSVTRYAMAAREIALAAGEPPVSRGYPPSVFAELPQLLERAGPGIEGKGSITGIFSVLVDGDNHNEPVADTVRGILDGHIVLDRTIANMGRFPAVDVLASISRLATKAWNANQATLASQARELIHRFEDSKDLRMLGSYQAGSDKMLDHALDVVPGIYAHLKQAADSLPDVDPFGPLAQMMRYQRGPQAAAAVRPTS